MDDEKRGTLKNNLPSDTWIDKLGDWMQLQGVLKKERAIPEETKIRAIAKCV